MGMARLTPGGKRVGLANGTEGSGYEGLSRIFHTHSVKVPSRTHAVTRGRRVAAAALGRPLQGAPEFMLDAPAAPDTPWHPRRPYAVFFHGTSRAAKRWGEAGWIALGNFVSELGYPVLLPWGSEEERQTAQRLAAAIPGAQVLPRLDMAAALQLAQQAALVVGVDTGLTHIAAAYCRPTVELYCDSPRWKTEGDWSAAIINLGDVDKPPTIDEVLQAVKTSLQAAKTPVSSST
jgi:heptosyltransferase-1